MKKALSHFFRRITGSAVSVSGQSAQDSPSSKRLTKEKSLSYEEILAQRMNQVTDSKLAAALNEAGVGMVENSGLGSRHQRQTLRS